MKKIDLKNGSIISLFWKFALPSIGMALIMSIYFVVDGIFIARGVGSNALAAINISMPFLIFIISVAVSLSIGASIIISIKISQNKKQEASRIFSTLLLINIVCGILFSAGGLMYLGNLTQLLGANADTVSFVKDYLSVMLVFIPVFTVFATLSTVVRNDQNPNLVLWAIVAGTLTNISLDALFIFSFGWGVKGAAWATGVSRVISVSILLNHFLLHKGALRFLRPSFNHPMLKRMIGNSIPVFLAAIFPAVSIFVMNMTTGMYMGTLGISAYAIISGISMLITTIFMGLSRGIQPIISFNHGINETDRIKKTLLIGVSVSFVAGLFVVILLWLFAEHIITLYAVNNLQLINLAKQGIHLYLLSFIFAGPNLMLISYLQSKERRKNALIISLFRGVIVIIVMAFVLPLFFGSKGVWLIIPFSEALTMTVILIIFKEQGTQLLAVSR